MSYSAACPTCGHDAEWDVMTYSAGRRAYQVGCTNCDVQIAWNPASGTEVAPH